MYAPVLHQRVALPKHHSEKAQGHNCSSQHLPVGDEVLALRELGRIARKTVTVTANNYPSKDPRTGDDLHINIRPYEEWFEVIAGVFGAERVQVLPSEYRSETFQVTL